MYEERWHLAIEASEMGVWDWNIPQDSLTWDKQALQVFGIDSQEFVNNKHSFNANIHPDDLEFVQKCTQMALDKDDKCHITFRYLQKDGSYTIITSKSKVSRNSEGKAVRLTGVCYREPLWVNDLCPYAATGSCQMHKSLKAKLK